MVLLLSSDTEAQHSITQYNIMARARAEDNSTWHTIGTHAATEKLLEHGTRVWKVRPVKNGEPQGPTYALKETWMRHDRLEDEVLAAARFTASNTSSLEELDNTVPVHHRQRNLAISGEWIMLMPSSSAGLFNPGTKRKHHGTTGQDITENVRHSKRLKTAARHGHDDSVFLNQQHREQRRMVLMETGVPVHDLRTYADVWTALEGGVEGLYTLHQQGFVHRDINSGNILLIGAGLEKRGVIVDLEYAKGVHDKPAPHDAKKGTAAFMAIQVQQLEYTHIPPPKPEFSDELDPPGFRQNALHDLESVWWLSLWVLFYLVRPDEPKLPDYHWNFSRVFGRAQLWHSDGRYHKCSSHFPDGSKFRHIMNMWAYQTKGYYAESYASGNYVVIDIDLINKAYRTQKETLQSLRDDTQSYPLKLKCLADFDRVSSELAAPPATTRKRLN